MRLSTLLIALLLPFLAAGQHLEAGLTVGASNYLGDLSENSSRVFLKETHFSGGIFGRYNVNDFVGVRLGLQYGSLSGTDANADAVDVRQRNLSFKTNIYEVSLTGEFNILGYQPYALSRVFSPYLFGGIAFFHFNPQAEYEFQTIDLQPLGTEGQGLPDRPEPYRLTEFAIPFGLGLKYALSDKWNLGLELGIRKTFTDYLDDVSTTYVAYEELLAARGEQAANLAIRQLDAQPGDIVTGTPRGDDTETDTYFILGFSISYNFLDNGLVGSRGRNRNRKGCQTF